MGHFRYSLNIEDTIWHTAGLLFRSWKVASWSVHSYKIAVDVNIHPTSFHTILLRFALVLILRVYSIFCHLKKWPSFCIKFSSLNHLYRKNLSKNKYITRWLFAWVDRVQSCWLVEKDLIHTRINKRNAEVYDMKIKETPFNLKKYGQSK